MNYRKGRTKTPDQRGFNIRHQLGCTQMDMATYLIIDRAHYGMYESGRRTLPDEVLDRKIELLTQLKNPLAETNAYSLMMEQEEEDLKQHFQKQLEDLKSLIYSQERKLTGLETEFNSRSEAIKNLARIQFDPKGINYPGNQTWVDLMLNLRRSEIEKCSRIKQAEAKQKLLSLMAQKKYCEDTLNSFGQKLI
jgi:transcriptional regulator with XRE-family HTH domain